MQGPWWDPLRKAVDKRGKFFKKNGVELTHTIQEGIGPLLGDHTKISQVLYHLVMNGLKFTHSGHVKADITSDSSKRQMDVKVSDTMNM